MNNSPNATRPRYQKIRELGRNRAGGRVTYLARDNSNEQPVVIKQFQFAQSGSDWSGFKAYEREMQVLRSLNHPGIPRYLNSFETRNGFCMVQEYKDAQPLSVRRSFAPDEIKQIAVSILEILVYLQERIPSVIHRDIKPENILVDDQLNVYLVDFGFARIGGGEVVALSSMVAGTTGFMPPEQLLNRPLTEASDLYGLGATLVCLLTGTKSTDITNLIDSSYRINFKPLLIKLSFRFIEWLENMVQPNFNDRYPNAAAALEALIPVYVFRLPEVEFSQASLEFTATKLGQQLTQRIVVSNSAPDTVLEGRWEVAPHPSDPPHKPNSHAWILLHSADFKGNQAECKVTVYTSKLMAGKTYNRQLVLHTNSEPEAQRLEISVKTAPQPIETKKPPFLSIAFLCFFYFIEFMFLPTIKIHDYDFFKLSLDVGLWMVPSQYLLALASWIDNKLRGNSPLKAAIEGLVALLLLVCIGCGGILGANIGGWTFGKGFVDTTMQQYMWDLILVLGGASIGGIASFFAVIMVATIISSIEANMAKEGLGKIDFLIISTLAFGLGSCLGVWYKMGRFNPLLLAAIWGIGVALAVMLTYPPLGQAILIAKYRKAERNLIKP